MQKIITIYLVIGFVINFIYMVWDKWKHPHQQPRTLLEVVLMTLMFIIGIPFWPMVWSARFRKWRD